MSDWSTLETVMFVAALLLGVLALGILLVRRKLSSVADWVIAVSAIAIMIATFLPWYRVEFVKFSLWDTHRSTAFIIMGMGAVALVIIALRVLMFGKSADTGARGPLLEGLALLVLSIVAAVLALIRWGYVPDTKIEFSMTFVYVRSWGLWVGLFAAGFFIVGSVMKLLEKR